MPDVRTVPALPWPTGDGGGTIKLSRTVTEQELIDGILKITLDNDGREYNATILRYQDNSLRVKADNDVFIISPIPHGSDTLTLTRIDDPTARAYSLINVELILPPEMTITPELPATASPMVVFSRPVTKEEIKAHIQMELDGEVVAYQDTESIHGWYVSSGYLYFDDFEGETTSIVFKRSGAPSLRVDRIFWV